MNVLKEAYDGKNWNARSHNDHQLCDPGRAVTGGAVNTTNIVRQPIMRQAAATHNWLLPSP